MSPKKGTPRAAQGSQRGETHPTGADAKALQLIRESGVLNPSVTLDRILEVTRQLAAVEPPKAERHTDTFIHSHFIYKHEDLTDKPAGGSAR